MMELTYKWYLSFILCALMAIASVEAQEVVKPYFIDGEEIVFVFDIRDYTEATDEEGQETLDFLDLDIERVAVTGEFTKWSRDGWVMRKTGEFTYQLRKNISDFGDAFPLEFKYIVNDQYWAEPGQAFPTTRKFDNEFMGDVYNLTLYDVVPSIEGNTYFFLAGYDNVDAVILTGTFVDWDERYLKMEKVDDGWQMRLDLIPDRYEYKFIVDGMWIHDETNPSYVKNEHGTWNSVIHIAKPIEFLLKGYADAEQVRLVTSFNHWNQLPMEKSDDGWSLRIPVPTGKHHYKFVVDGRYIHDPASPLVERNKEGVRMSVLIVQ